MTTSQDEVITYRFHLASGIEDIVLRFDAADFSLRQGADAPNAEWARLDFHQCDNCPLKLADSLDCPFARAMVGFVTRFDQFYSYEEAEIEVITKSRTVIARKPLQHGMASLVGLIGATSGCPHLSFFRPMARYHLPFARDDETLYRVFSMHLLGSYLRGEADPGDALARLSALNLAATKVNEAMAERLRAAVAKDVVLNAVIVLDCFAQSVPYVIEEQLDEFRPIFALPQVAAR